MPELPDLEVFRGNLKKHLIDHSLLAVQVVNPKNVFPSAGPVLDQFIQQPLIAIERIGKELFFDFSGQKSFAVHLMLNGQFHLCRSREDVSAIGHPIAVFHFDTQNLVVSDPGRLCKILFMAKPAKAPDALSPDFTLEYLAERLGRNPLLNIKSFLIDQKIVKGIGNAYADEILWESRIAPQSLCGNLPPAAVALLHASIGKVLQEAIASILQEAPDIIRGEIRDFLKVHNPHRKHSPTGALIQVKKVASKTTYFTEEQILY
jgi:formamidopyrimidine-DNA glycosylase